MRYSDRQADFFDGVPATRMVSLDPDAGADLVAVQAVRSVAFHGPPGGGGLARGNGPSTSHAAARAIRRSLPKSRARVLLFLADRGDHGATDEEIGNGIEMKHAGVCARRNELIKNCDPQLVVCTDRTRLASAGLKVRVYIATAAGVQAAAEHRRAILHG